VLVNYSLVKSRLAFVERAGRFYQGTVCSWESSSSLKATRPWKVTDLSAVWSKVSFWRVDHVHDSETFVVFEVAHALRITSIYTSALRSFRHLNVRPLRPVQQVLVHLGVSLPCLFKRHGRTIVDPAHFVGMGFHLPVINELLFWQFCLVYASLSIQPVLKQVSLLVELLIDVSCFHQLALHKGLLQRQARSSPRCV